MAEIERLILPSTLLAECGPRLMRERRAKGRWLRRFAKSLFRDAINSGAGLDEALGAVYLSGLSHGWEIARRKRDRG